jgi:hypothetical protein
MSGSPIDHTMIRAIANRLANPGKPLSAGDEANFRAFFGAAASGGTDTTGFPAATGGDVNGWNSLSRTNWFNGRFLTAEALRRQDAYFDYRARLNAQVQMPGVAYGLGLSAQGLNATQYSRESVRQGGLKSCAPITLLPGLAFDMIGRPILVPTDFTFTIDDLTAARKTQPRMVVGGGTQFAPCVCLANDPSGPTGGSQAPPHGPFLLIIEAAEQACGDAKVYGSVCSGTPQPVTCQGDAWNGGFGLSLVRFPVDVPGDSARSAWDLRGILAAYYFDVFEHSLITRWDPPFATKHGFCHGAWSGRNDTGSVALAMVYLGKDGSAMWIDPWLPRRSIVATPGEDWHRTRFGAPPRASAWARIHQFQCMLAESLELRPLFNDNEFSEMNLLTRGFRHIPPIGFLPIEPKQAQRFVNPPNTGDPALDQVLAKGGAQAGIVSGYVAAARIMAQHYFANTNVYTYATVALHDDDILEDLANVFDKDPVQLDTRPEFNPGIERLLAAQPTPAPQPAAPQPAPPPPAPQPAAPPPGAPPPTGAQPAPSPAVGPPSATATTTPKWLLDLEVALLTVGIDDLVNRRIEIVKLVVPLQGLVRNHPILNMVAQDAQDQAASWGAPVDPTAQALSEGGLSQRFGLQMLPRHFVVYVKQRMVLLEAVFVMLELIKYLVDTALGANANAKAGGVSFPVVQQMRAATMAQPEQTRAVAAAALQHPAVQTAMTRLLPLVVPDLAVGSRNAAFQTEVNTQFAALATSIPDTTARRRAAVDRVTDSYAAVYPGFQALQVLAATQPVDQTEAMVRAIGLAAGTTAALGLAPSTTVEDAALKDGTPVFASADAAQLYAQVRAATAEKPVTTLVKNAPAGITIGEVLSKSPAEATALLGSTTIYNAFLNAVAGNVKKLAVSAQAAAAPPPARLATRLQAAVRASGGDITKAVETLHAATGHDAATTAYLANVAAVTQLLGPTRVAAAAHLLLKTG